MGSTITTTAADGHTLDAYRADPEGKPKGAIVVIQEIFGVNAHMRAVTDGFAAAGYLAIAPAMFDRAERGVEVGYDEADMARGRGVRAKIAWDDAVKDMEAAAAAVGDAGKVGVVGYCWGGSLAWLAATRMRVDGAVCYYGGQIPDFKDETPRCPTMLHFGEVDAGIPLDKVEAVRQAHPNLPLHLYPAGHGFNCDHRGSYDADSAKLALERTLAFFAQHVG